MTYLQLCQAVMRGSQTGTGSAISFESAADLSTVGHQYYDDYNSQIASYVREAWIRIQTMHETWGWRLRSFGPVALQERLDHPWGDLVPLRNDGFRSFVVPTPDDDSFAWKMYSGPQRKLVPRGVLEFIDRSKFDDLSIQPRTGVPTYASESFDGMSMGLYPMPGVAAQAADELFGGNPVAQPPASYSVRGWYQIGVQVLERAEDAPAGLPPEAHDAIKWRAIMMVHAANNAPQEEYAAKRQFDEYLIPLRRRYLPEARLSPAIE